MALRIMNDYMPNNRLFKRSECHKMMGLNCLVLCTTWWACWGDLRVVLLFTRYDYYRWWWNSSVVVLSCSHSMYQYFATI